MAFEYISETEALHQEFMQISAYRQEFEALKPVCEIAEMILKARIEAKLTQKQLAERLGTTQSVISRIESLDYGGVNVQTLQKIAEALGLTLQITFLKKP